ncbi:MAG: hypothetical protein HYU04_00595 [Candidatus Wildermuthbacteria bacterium]|nr:hypothetical protein [Candidatus Wildermuthbacteria bacterium]
MKRIHRHGHGITLGSLAIVLVGILLTVFVSAAIAPPPPGGDAPPPPGGDAPQPALAVGPVGVDSSWGAEENLYPLRVYSGSTLRVMSVEGGRLVLAELGLPDSLYPVWAVDFTRVSWVVWPVDVLYSGNSDIRAGDIVDVKMIEEGLGFRVTKIRLTQVPSG